VSTTTRVLVGLALGLIVGLASTALGDGRAIRAHEFESAS
jgi:hypothetical protein